MNIAIAFGAIILSYLAYRIIDPTYTHGQTESGRTTKSMVKGDAVKLILAIVVIFALAGVLMFAL